ncbi:MAG: hypothetical protein ABTQ29_06060 [Siculibacillus sp.]
MRPHLYRKTGSEPLTHLGRSIGHSVLDFWRWSVSDLVSNATRGVLAEFIVGAALGVDFSRVRDEWQAWDLTAPNGLKIEVKSAAYVQSWAQERPSRISFSIKGTKPQNFKAGEVVEAVHHSDVYVFCLLATTEPETIDPLALEQWRFYAVATSLIDGYRRSRHSITLPSLDGLVKGYPRGAAGPMPFDQLRASILRHPEKHLQDYLPRVDDTD